MSKSQPGICQEIFSKKRYYLFQIGGLSGKTMSGKYKIRDPDSAYFITMTIVDWVDVFTRPDYKIKIVEFLRWCQKNKGLEIFAGCLLTNHLHIIVKSVKGIPLSDILRDFKKFTSHSITGLITEIPESRRQWMIARFVENGKAFRRFEKYKFWQDGNHPEIISNTVQFYQKLNYIHNNPVKEMIVENPEDYLFSSARNYAGRSALLEIVLETPQLRTY
jgi:putative transposase